MKRKISILFIVFLLIATGTFILIKYNKSNIDYIAKKLVKLNPTATIQNINIENKYIKPSKVILVSIENEKIFLYEFKDKVSAEKAMPILCDGVIDGNVSVGIQNNIVIRHFGSNEKIAKQLKDLLH